MISSVALYEALTTAPDDRARARVIAEAFERLEERYLHLPELATQAHVRESELRLQKEIELVRAEIEQVRAELKLDIEQVRAQVEQVRADLTLEIARSRNDLLKWLFPMLLAQVGVIAALVKLL
jgi:crotonobetainyl-CoA:carnitine CoA-transferase CaiB-like acyl-CoA transferase